MSTYRLQASSYKIPIATPATYGLQLWRYRFVMVCLANPVHEPTRLLYTLIRDPAMNQIFLF